MKYEDQTVEPEVGETVKIVKTLRGGNHPNGFSKIRVEPTTWVGLSIHPTIVQVTGKRTDNNGVRKVRFTNIVTGEEYPEVKMGALLHAAKLVEANDTPDILGSLELAAYQRRHESEMKENCSPFSALAGLKAKMEAERQEMVEAGFESEQEYILASDLIHDRLIAASDQKVKVVVVNKCGVIVEVDDGRRTLVPADLLKTAILGDSDKVMAS